MLVVKRIGRGVASHFPVRASEWLMICPTFGMGLALMLQPAMFDTSPSFSVLSRWADEAIWSTLAILCAVLRLVALVVNGTFARFPYSPHLRAFASFAGAGLWGQFTLAFTSAALAGGGSLSPVVAYSTFLLAEFLNIWRSFADLGRLSR